MSAAAAIQRLRAAGLELQADGDDLIVRPASRVTTTHRELVRIYKAQIVQILGNEQNPQVAPPPILDPADRTLADAYLDAIGETDPELRAEYLDNLARNPRFIPQMHAAAVAAGVARWNP
ncbi:MULTISPECIES: hypothetical protein [unclassified Thiocapsa]|uniref:hypothetical protein n=1 Tax=unclassified Thiocapsa TaxID=2641286 RepID=UPI0035B20D31